MLRIISLFVIYLIAFLTQGQNLKSEVIEIVRVLSDSFDGRGYQNDGAIRSAQWIKTKMEKIGLHPAFENGYFQTFFFPFNVIEDFSVNKSWEVGKDFWLHNKSPNGSFEGKIYEIPEKLLKESPDNSISAIKGIVKKNQGKWLLFHIHDGANADWEGMALAIAQASTQIMGIIICKGDKLPPYGIPEGKPFEKPVLTITHEVSQSISKKDILKLIVQSQFKKKQKAVNVGGCLQPIDSMQRMILLTAHYDHLGRLKDAVFHGAHDNASGTAFMLALIDTLKSLNLPINVCAIATGAEETGLNGAIHLSENFPVSLDSIVFLINLDLWGTGDKGIMVVNGKIDTVAFAILDSINKECKCLPQVKARGISRASDHWAFQEKGVRTFFIYTLGGNPGYHVPDDTIDRLSFKAINGGLKLLTAFIKVISQ